ncbi:MAG: GNVR domain-containing protein [Hoeflea sp.]|nr:GNVR domain-containing protein [Hoeflea sp.]
MPSLLATPSRRARLSTAPHAGERRDPEAVSADAAPARTEPVRTSREDTGGEAPAGLKPRDDKPGREKFGDRITRLIGTVPPRHTKVASAAEPEDRPLSAPPPSVKPDSIYPAPPRWEARERETAPPPPRARPEDQGRDDHYHWHAAAPGGRGDDGSRPLLDASILIAAVVRYWKQIGAAAVIGAVAGVLMALSTPHRYYAESRLFIDPREVRVTEDDVRNQQLSTEAMLAITDSQLQILSSTSVLQKVVADLGLDRDPEFNGSLPSGGLSGGLTLIRELFTGAGGQSDAEQKALEKLRDSLSVARDAKTFVIIVGVDSRDAQKSALIANQVVETYLDSEGQAQSSLLERTSESIDTRINALRADLDAAEREVERFKAENGLVGVGGKYIDDDVILALSEQLANARALKIGIQVKANNLTRVNINDVLSGAFPEELLSSNLTELRKQYTETRSNAESLATSLGPRHPRYVAAKSSMDTIRNEISAELRRIVASSQTELQRAVETEQELNSQMAVAKSRAMDQSVEFVTLRELERKAAATRGIYEAFLTRSRETSERSNFTTRNVRVISPAEAPLQPMGPSRKLIAIGGLFAGLFAGLGLALAAGAVESIRAYNSGPVQARFQTPPFGDYPAGPEPSPRTPPQGSPRRGWRRDAGESAACDRAADEATAAAFAAPRAAASGDPAPHPAQTVYPGAAPGPDQPAPDHRPVRAADNETVPMSYPYLPAYAQPVFGAGFAPAEPARTFAGPAPHLGYAQPQSPHPSFDQGRPAQGYVAAQAPFAQPQPMMQPPMMPAPQMMAAPQAPGFYPAPYPAATNPSAHDPRGHDPRQSQPLWTAYPAHVPAEAQVPYQPLPQVQPHASIQPQLHPQAYPAYPAYPSHAAAPTAPYPAVAQAPAPAYAMSQPGYGPPQPGYGQPQPVYSAPQPVQPMPAQPAPVWPQAAPHAPVAPHMQAAPYQAAPAPVVSQPAPAPQPAAQPPRADAVDRIRRDMDVLRSRIDGYGASRRHA